MSTKELGTTGPCTVNQEGDRGLIPPQLKDVIELASSTNQKIEDCAVEWQAKISQAQWKILDGNQVDNKPWEQSVLARTYFTDKILDDAFQGLLKHNKTFTDHLQNFVALVCGEQPTLITRQTCNAQNQCSDFGHEDAQLLATSSLLSSGPSLDEKSTSNNVLNKAQDSFTDLIKSKIDFDTKFLGFEATLNGNSNAKSDPSLGLCQICSRILGCGMGKGCKSLRNHKNVQLYKKKMRRSSRIKHKRLASKKTMCKIKEKNVAEKKVKESAHDNSFSDNKSHITSRI